MKVLAILAVVATLGLTACGAETQTVPNYAPEQPTSTPTTNPTEPTNRYDKEVFLVQRQLSDGRTADCVLWDSYKTGGIDCDFAHAK